MSRFNSRAEYYACIIESAYDELKEDPTHPLYHQVSINISGGHSMWDDVADELFKNPQNLEEALLALEMRTILEYATRNQLRKVRFLSQQQDVGLDIFGFPMDFGVLLGTVCKLAVRSVPLALYVKVEMAAIAARVDRRSLPDFIGAHCLSDTNGGDHWCAQF